MIQKLCDAPCRTLRGHIKSTAILADKPQQKLYSRIRVIQLLSADRIKSVLECSCLSCSQSRIPSNESNSSEELEMLIQSYRLVFALFTVVGYPQLSFSFLRKGWDDVKVQDDIVQQSEQANPQQVTSQGIRGALELFLRPQDDTKYDVISKDLYVKKYRFFVPKFEEDADVVLPHDTILPFKNEEPIYRINDEGKRVPDGGQSGQLFGFEIESEYHEFPSVTELARKKILNQDVFKEEKENLKLVKRLKSPHIIRLLASFQHGDAYCLVFERAQTNLDQWLRYSVCHDLVLLCKRIEISPIWKQMIGIAHALEKITNYNIDGEGGKLSRFGYYLDLKPANILVNRNANHQTQLRMCDFHRSYFRAPSGASYISGRGGTTTYAPPEVERDGLCINRKYDVWSFGCILLEVVVFAVGGRELLSEFDKSRLESKSYGRVQGDGFFGRKRWGTHFEVKKAVSSCLENLSHNPGIQFESSRRFVKALCELIGQMLRVNVKERLCAWDVYVKLEDLVNGCQPILLVSRDTLMVDQGTTMSTWSGTKSGRLLEDASQAIYLLVHQETDSLEIPIGFRKNIGFIPSYCQPTNPTRDTVKLAMIPGPMSSGPEEALCRVARMKDFTHAVEMHSALLGQTIKGTFLLFSGDVEIASDRKKQDALKALPELYQGQAVLQLWSEISFRRAKIETKADSRAPRMALNTILEDVAPPRRIVIYYENTVLMVQFSKSVRIEKKEATADRPLQIRLIPVQSSTDSQRSRIRASSWCCSQNDELKPCFPLDRPSFKSLEEENKIKVRSISLTFQSADELERFCKEYKLMKIQWRKETDDLDHYTSQIGQHVGYAAR